MRSFKVWAIWEKRAYPSKFCPGLCHARSEQHRGLGWVLLILDNEKLLSNALNMTQSTLATLQKSSRASQQQLSKYLLGQANIIPIYTQTRTAFNIYIFFFSCPVTLPLPLKHTKVSCGHTEVFRAYSKMFLCIHKIRFFFPANVNLRALSVCTSRLVEKRSCNKNLNMRT